MRRNNNIIAISNKQVADVKMSTVIQEYLTHMERRGLSAYSIKHDQENLHVITTMLLGDPSVSSLTTEKIEVQVFDPMRKKGLAPITINGRIKTLRQLLNYAVEQGYLQTNVALRIQKMVETQEGVPALSEKQIDMLLNQCDLTRFTGLRDYAMISMMIDTGIRLRELTSLEVAQIDVRHQMIRSVFGKNRKTEDIPLSSAVCDVVEKYMKERNRVEVSTDVVFVTITGTPLNRGSIQKLVKQYGKMAGITDIRVSPHTFRHTLAKHWIMNNGDAFTLQKVLRHSNLDMVKRYVHLWGHEVAERHEKFSPMAKRKMRTSRSMKDTKSSDTS